LVAALSMAAASPALAAESIGHVKVVTGEVSVERNGAVEPLAPGKDLFQGDTLRTSEKSTLGVILRDDTTLSLGPTSRMVLDELVFDPAGGALGMGLTFAKGTFSVVSGQIAKLAPERTTISTPAMSIGIRGTSFLVEVAE
jgi:hypothetical protein